MRACLLFTLLVIADFSYGQAIELSFNVGSGLFWFGGSSPTNSTVLHVSDVGGQPSTPINPYGRNSGPSYSIGTNLLQTTKSNFIFGLGLSYESLTSKARMDEAIGEIAFTVDRGSALYNTSFINFFPSIGRRVKLIDHIETDILIGIDIGWGISSRERFGFTTTDSNSERATSEWLDKVEPPIDLRPRVELVNYYKRYGLSLGYSHGISDYRANEPIGYLVEGDYADVDIKSRFIRVGIHYKLKY